MDDSSSVKGGGIDIVLYESNNLLLEQSLRFGFKPSNNQVEYKVLIAGLILATDMRVENITYRSNSQIMVGHLDGMYQVKDLLPCGKRDARQI